MSQCVGVMLRRISTIYGTDSAVKILLIQLVVYAGSRDVVLRPSESEMAKYGILISSGMRFDIQKCVVVGGRRHDNYQPRNVHKNMIQNMHISTENF